MRIIHAYHTRQKKADKYAVKDFKLDLDDGVSVVVFVGLDLFARYDEVADFISVDLPNWMIHYPELEWGQERSTHICAIWIADDPCAEKVNSPLPPKYPFEASVGLLVKKLSSLEAIENVSVDLYIALYRNMVSVKPISKVCWYHAYPINVAEQRSKNGRILAKLRSIWQQS